MLERHVKSLGISQAGLALGLDVSVTAGGMGQALWRRQQKGRVPLGFWSQLWKAAETQYSPMEQQVLTEYTVLLQGEPLTKEQQTVLRTSLPVKGVG